MKESIALIVCFCLISQALFILFIFAGPSSLFLLL